MSLITKFRIPSRTTLGALLLLAVCATPAMAAQADTAATADTACQKQSKRVVVPMGTPKAGVAKVQTRPSSTCRRNPDSASGTRDRRVPQPGSYGPRRTW